MCDASNAVSITTLAYPGSPALAEEAFDNVVDYVEGFVDTGCADSGRQTSAQRVSTDLCGPRWTSTDLSISTDTKPFKQALDQRWAASGNGGHGGVVQRGGEVADRSASVGELRGRAGGKGRHSLGDGRSAKGRVTSAQLC
ncbi:hypothetical protein B0H16DRAFT_1468604 [Mycena metata]|uniref:Uncharacterized protein n=1 Tax=Mycena metata TaxID=1033252 RepID=A0AAD7I299_9AGAR|nr:hypothetical protein B0H16DRAFT_1468604 [Mycena metata]